jgi:phospholipase C
MKLFAKGLFLLVWLGSSIAHAQTQPANPTSFQHVVVIFQENRTPDNLFQGLCTSPTICNINNPTTSQYNIQTSNWLDDAVAGGVIQPTPVALANTYDLSHAHSAWVTQCDLNPTTGLCRMDGAAGVNCSPDPNTTCPPNPQFKFVDNSSGILNPYLTLATSYGWANYMFQTNEGPSFPAHQYIFGATSAPSSDEDHNGTYASENMSGTGAGAGCVADAGVLVQLIDKTGTEDPNNKIYPCFEHDTVPDLTTATLPKPTWRYYAPGAGSIWTAPDAIIHICGPSNGKCTGTEWVDNVDATNPADFLTDVASPNCKLKQVTWVIPTAANSDHAKSNNGGGPSWVASLVNAIGNNTCTNPDGTSFWNTTAIFIAWDDWGGWYDHEVPTILQSPFGGYQLGFRVPLIVVSAFTSKQLINNNRHDFGSIVRFIEQNFGYTEGQLTFADSRAKTDLTGFFDLTTARKFVTIPGGQSTATFLAQPVVGPDDDED